MSQMCVDAALLPSGKLIVIGLSDWCKFLAGVPFMIKTEVAIACDVAIAIAFAHSTCLYSVVQFDAMTVSLSSSYDNVAAS
jgi:hypothetical protein